MIQRGRSSSTRERARRLVATLALTFGLTIASFLASTAIAEHQQRGIEQRADMIAQTAIPGMELLSSARTELRHIDEALDDIVYRDAHPFTLDDERADFRKDLARYAALPDFPGEAAVWRQVKAREADIDASISRLIALVNAHDRSAAAEELTTRTRPALRAVADALRDVGEINLRASAGAAGEIRSLRRSSSTLRFLLSAASAASAAVAALLVVGMARRFVRLTDERLEEMDRFAGRVAHDIKSPLNTVNLSLELARRSPTIDAKTQTTLDRGLRTLERIDQLIVALLEFARAGRPETGMMTRVGDILPSLLDDVRKVAEDKRILLETEIPASAAATRLACSPGVLLSLVSNLLNNAIKYMGDSPKRCVLVRAIDVGGVLRVEVSDTGPGVPVDLVSRIFDPYTRAEHGSIPGLGLGLAIVRRLAEAHGGSCGVESTLGLGSCFWFELPKASGRAQGGLLATAS